MEHAYPQWLNRALGIEAAGGIVYSTFDKGRVRDVRVFDLTVREVCKDCNGGWLHEPEESFRAVMLGPIQGNVLPQPMH